MTWYFNNDGAADGPYDDEAMAAMLAQKRLQAHTLIWHPGAEVWQEITSLAPSWWQAPPAAKVVRANKKSVNADAPTTRHLVPTAPSADSTPNPQPSFLKRLFSWGRK